MWRRYGRYLEAPPLLVVEWSDADTDAHGWLVINSLRGGAAGGGTRMRKGVTREEVTYLAKAMQLKFAFSGPPIGGAKSGIAFDPEDPRRDDVLRRWFSAIRPYLATCYGTGGDVNVDEERDVVPLCRELGIVHPQEGVVRGHLGLRGEALDRAFTSLGDGLRQAVGDADLRVAGRQLNVSDLITGYGVAQAARQLNRLRGCSIEGKRVIVEGFGNVGAACALYLSRMGAVIVGLVDAESGLASPDGLAADEVEDLLRRRRGRLLPEHPLRHAGTRRDEAYRQQADIFVPAAISGSVDARRLAQLARDGVAQIVCGANQPFREVRLGETVTYEAADAEFEIIPDVVGSQGMARAFYHLMTHRGTHTPGDIFTAVGAAMEESVTDVVERVGNRRIGLAAAALGIALDRMER